MQAVILAGGLGTRLGALTQKVPKPLVPVAGVPYLEHQIALLRRQSILDIVLLTGYLGEQVEAHFGDGSRFGVSIRYSQELSPLGTGGALRQGASLLAEDFLVIYGDSYLPIEYGDVLRLLRAGSAVGVVVVYDNRLADTSVRNNIELGPDNRVERYEKDAKPSPELAYVEAGVLAFRKTVLDFFPGKPVVSLEQEIFPQIIARRELLGFPTSQRFYDIGTPERLQVIEELLTHDHHQNSVSN